MARAIVLGAGMVGAVIGESLAEEAGWEVAVADRDPEALRRVRDRAGARTLEIRPVEADLADEDALRMLLTPFDVVVGGVPGALGLRALKSVIEAGKRCVDISFMPEDPRALSATAEQSGACVVYDMGVAPGMSNLLAMREAQAMESVDRVRILVGGLPVERRRPFEYKAGFSPRDVLEEYTRPARIRRAGATRTVPALGEVETLDEPGVGTLEAFLTDGLRSLLDTIDCPDMEEKTIRYPGHADLIATLRDVGLLDESPIEAGGVSVRPIDVAAALALPRWTFEEGEADVTIMRIEVEGVKDSTPTRARWTLRDQAGGQPFTRSMSRVTAYPAAACARLLVEGDFSAPGVHPPERLAQQEGIVEQVLEYQSARGVAYERSETTFEA